MAVKPLQTIGDPLSVDGIDAELPTFKGGEFVTITSVLDSADLAVSSALKSRGTPVLTKHKVASKAALTETSAAVYLVDDGLVGYSNMLGTVVGGSAGRVNGVPVGPHSSFASGCLTLWRATGSTFAITLDAVATDLATPGTATVQSGDAVYADVAGGTKRLTAVATGNRKVGIFQAYESSKGLCNDVDQESAIDCVVIEFTG